jgi:hypothetical protein
MDEKPKGKNGGRREGAGRKPFIPTDEHRKMVKMLAGLGTPEETIVNVIINPQTGNPIDKKTLLANFRSEIDTGKMAANSKVAESLFNMATNTRKPNVVAAIFWLKTQARWKEAKDTPLQNTGEDGEGLTITFKNGLKDGHKDG